MQSYFDLQNLTSYLAVAKDFALIIFAALGFPLLKKRTHSANLTARAALEKSVSDRYLNALRMIDSESTSSRMSGLVELLDIAEKHHEYRVTVALAAKNYISERLYYAKKYVGTREASEIAEENRKKILTLARSNKIKALKTANTWHYSHFSLLRYRNLKGRGKFIFSEIDNNIAFKNYLNLIELTNLKSEDRVFRGIACDNFQLYDQRLSELFFFNSVFSSVNFQGAVFTNVRFNNCDFHNVFFAKTRFMHCEFNRCSFFGVRFQFGSSEILDNTNFKYSIDSILPSYDRAKTKDSYFVSCRFFHTDCRPLLGVRDLNFVNCEYDNDSFEQARVFYLI